MSQLTIPPALMQEPAFMVWRYEERDGKPTKVPFRARNPRERASATDPETWATFVEAERAFADPDGRFDGVGRAITADLVGVDFDNALDAEGRMHAWAADLFALLPATYAEVSPSGRGFKLWLRGTKPAGCRCKRNGFGADGNGAVEVYDGGRYFTLTGNRLGDAPLEVAEAGQGFVSFLEAARLVTKDAEIFDAAPQSRADSSVVDFELRWERMLRSAKGPAIQRLLAGDRSGHNGDDSGADLALCNYLAFWFVGDAATIDREFRRSGLMRPKWDERHASDGSTYGEMTIRKAIADSREHYKPNTSTARGMAETATLGGNCGQEGAAAPFAKWQPVTLAKCMERREPIPFVVDGLLPESTVVLLHAGGGSHKTNVAVDLSICIAMGHDWLVSAGGESGRTFTIPQARPVIWISQDTPSREMQDRIGACARAHGAGTDTPLYAYTFPDPPLDMTQRLHATGLRELVERHGAGAVFIDNLSVISGDADENSASEMRPVMTGLRRVADGTRATIVIIHHETKAGGYRGTSTIRDLVDISLELKRDGQSDEVAIHADKCRFAPVPPFGARFLFEHWPDGDGHQMRTFRFAPAAFESDDETAAAIMLRIVRENPDSSKNVLQTLAKGTGLSREKVRKAIEQLARDGKIVPGKGTRNAQPFRVAA